MADNRDDIKLLQERYFIAEQLRRAREKSGLTVEDTAAAIGKSTKTVYSYESGRTRPTPELFIQMCRLYSVDIDYFFPSSQQIPYKHLTRDEAMLVDIYNDVSNEGKRALVTTARAIQSEYGFGNTATED